MCAPSQGAMLPYGLKIPSPYFPFGPSGGLTQAHLSALDFQRSQLNDYNVRVQLGLRNYQTSLGLSPFHAYITDPYTQAYFYKHDPRARFVQEEPKPSHSYIGLIGMAILNSKEKKLVLSDIYQWILDNYPYFRTRGPGWRNSIRHNLSLNDCFIKAGRSANGKGHYWAVHPANVEDFERGDFRRRRAQRKVRRHMGLSVPDDDDSPTPSPTQPWPHHDINQDSERAHLDPLAAPGDHAMRSLPTGPDSNHLVLSHPTPTYGPLQVQPRKPSKKRLFDMASLLAPDDDEEETDNSDRHPHNDMMQSQQMHVSGFSFHPIHDIKAHDMKAKSSSESMADSNGSNSTQELTVDVNSTSSGSGKEMSCDSDYDGDNDNDEIQVTSGENSPALGMSEPCDTVSEQAINGRYDNRNGKNRCVDEHNAMQMLGQDPSKMSSSPYFSESKVENALDLSSSNASEGEKKLNAPLNNGDDSKNNVMVRENGDSHQKGMNGNNLSIQEPDRENCNRQDNPKTYNERNASGGEVISDCGRDRNFENDQKSKFRNRNFIQTGRDIKTETPTQLSNNGREHSKFCTEKLHYFRSEKKDINRPQGQHRSESNFSGGDSNLTDAEQCNQMDMRTITSSGHSSPVSETDHTMRWADMSKASSLPRDRMSAFSTLSGRNHSMYSPFQLRNYGVAQHRFLPTSSPLRTGVPAPLLTVTSSSPGPVSSVAVMKGMDISSSKCSSISGNTNHSSNNNSTSSMGTGGHIRD